MSTRERILDKALDLFNQSGMYKTGVREIARSLEISPGNLSYHFARKEDLLIALLERYGETNDALYAAYFDGEPGLGRYLELISTLLENAYSHRGAFLGLDELRAVIGAEYDYRVVEEKRRSFLDHILTKLEGVGDLNFDEMDKAFMIDFIAFFQRCWIMEAMISYAHLDKTQIISRYMRFVAMQFAQIATLKGQRVLGRWL
ncbi:MAG: TetR/AcrR family transcriptional regulator [Saprospiraceae bacterium]|nr:TetR/AcrR family transcriptional regulator [Saprospiraceae bacterium]